VDWTRGALAEKRGLKTPAGKFTDKKSFWRQNEGRLPVNFIKFFRLIVFWGK
jgi:hypothetical protein